MRFKIHCDSLIVGSKFAVFALVYFVFEGLYLEGQFNGGFFALPDWGGGGVYFLGLIHGGAYFRHPSGVTRTRILVMA